MQSIKKLLYILSPSERKHAILLLLLFIVLAIFEMVGVVSILPFMAVLMNPEIVETNVFLKKAFEFSSMFGIESNQEFLFFLGIVVFIILLLSIAIKALAHYLQTLFTHMCNYSFAKRLVEGYLHQPYSWFLSRHSADLGKTILSEVSIVIKQSLFPMLTLIKQGVITLALLIILIIADPKLTFIVGLTLGSAYGIIYIFTRRFIKNIGEDRLEFNKWLFTSVSNAFGAVKEIKVGGLEKIYIERFSFPAKNLAKVQAIFGVINQLPRFALEAIVFGGMLLVVLYLISQFNDISRSMPIIALYAYTSYRLMPALQGIFFCITQIRYTGPTLDAIYNDVKNLQPFDSSLNDQEYLKLNNNITLKNIHYHYPNVEREALKNLNFSIKSGTTVGIVGATGSGKTTTVDIILGLLEAQKGMLEVDGKVINRNNLRAWQRSIGYVPQHIFLADDTVSANIAFGVDSKLINQTDVERAGKIANLHKFVTDELPDEYQTTVGERGIRLSGGERQRIGIARALYHKPKVLILDEATSALDNITEKAVMNSLHKMEKNITIIMIAHRLSTVKECDTIFLLDKGELRGQGKFEELIKDSDYFRESANNL